VNIRLGTAWETAHDTRGRVEIYPEPRDAWIGMYVADDAVYLCPLPFVVVRISRGRSES
jgi:hypothetical protein